jgi:hypothetical protein
MTVLGSCGALLSAISFVYAEGHFPLANFIAFISQVIKICQVVIFFVLFVLNLIHGGLNICFVSGGALLPVISFVYTCFISKT